MKQLRVASLAEVEAGVVPPLLDAPQNDQCSAEHNLSCSNMCCLTTVVGQAGTGGGVGLGVDGDGSGKKSICLDFVLLKKKKKKKHPNLVWSVFLLSTWVFIASGKGKTFLSCRGQIMLLSPLGIQALTCQFDSNYCAGAPPGLLCRRHR